MSGDDAEQNHKVVINQEEQYSIWLAERGIPPGWRAIGFCGTREACLKYIDKIWTDMRPASLRARLAVREQ
jgi:MbtH protein